MSETPEGAVKKAVKKMLETFDVYWYMGASGGFGSSGFPDFVCCVDGFFLTIECKAGNNTPTLLQDREMGYIRDAGGIALVINENNLDELAVHLAVLKGRKHHG